MSATCCYPWRSSVENIFISNVTAEIFYRYDLGFLFAPSVIMPDREFYNIIMARTDTQSKAISVYDPAQAISLRFRLFSEA